MVKQYTAAEDIQKIIALLQKYRAEEYHFTKHYEFRIQLRDIKHEFLLKTYREFEKVKLINEDVVRGDIGYDLHYEISKNQTLIVGVIPKEKQLVFTHGILRPRKWQGMLKQ